MTKKCLKCDFVNAQENPLPVECPYCGAVYAKVEAAIAEGLTVRRTSPQMNSPERDIVLQKSTTWATRSVAYFVAAGIILPMLWGYTRYKQAGYVEECERQLRSAEAQKPGVPYTQQLAACVANKGAILESIPLNKTALPATARASLPCRFIGIWSSSKGDGPLHKVTLNEDGRYLFLENTGAGGKARTHTGSWEIQARKMVWHHDDMAALDINPILEEAERRFTLIEENGTYTEFKLLEEINAPNCIP